MISNFHFEQPKSFLESNKYAAQAIAKFKCKSDWTELCKSIPPMRHLWDITYMFDFSVELSKCLMSKRCLMDMYWTRNDTCVKEDMASQILMEHFKFCLMTVSVVKLFPVCGTWFLWFLLLLSLEDLLSFGLKTLLNCVFLVFSGIGENAW